jgi:hypothetical protein
MMMLSFFFRDRTNMGDSFFGGVLRGLPDLDGLPDFDLRRLRRNPQQSAGDSPLQICRVMAPEGTSLL